MSIYVLYHEDHWPLCVVVLQFAASTTSKPESSSTGTSVSSSRRRPVCCGIYSVKNNALKLNSIFLMELITFTVLGNS